LFGLGRGTARAEDDRRVQVRFTCSLETSLSEAHELEPESISAHVENISRSGIRLRVPRRFALGELVSLELPVGEAGTTTTLLACVVHCQPQADEVCSVGCAFLSELSDDDLLIFGARRIRPTPPDQRSWMRFPCHPSARYRLARTPDAPARPIEVLDLSSGGVALKTTDPVRVGEVLSLEFQQGDKPPVVTTLASVVRIRSEPDGSQVLGCTFIGELSESQISLLL
jgi:hypothetical protein